MPSGYAKNPLEKSRKLSAIMGEVNRRLGRVPPSRKGAKHSEETKMKMRGRRGGKGHYREWQEREAGRKRPECCELCGAMGMICFDHDHQTGKFRGWLCQRCNLVLGMVKDSTDLLGAMSSYLRKIE